jgi:hypothetical protein
MSCTRKVETNRDRKSEMSEEQSQEHAHNSLCHKGIVHKEFLLAGQTINSAYYCDGLQRLRENVRRLRPNICDKGTGCRITTTHRVTLPFLAGTDRQ